MLKFKITNKKKEHCNINILYAEKNRNLKNEENAYQKLSCFFFSRKLCENLGIDEAGK